MNANVWCANSPGRFFHICVICVTEERSLTWSDLYRTAELTGVALGWSWDECQLLGDVVNTWLWATKFRSHLRAFVNCRQDGTVTRGQSTRWFCYSSVCLVIADYEVWTSAATADLLVKHCCPTSCQKNAEYRILYKMSQNAA